MNHKFRYLSSLINKIIYHAKVRNIKLCQREIEPAQKIVWIFLQKHFVTI